MTRSLTYSLKAFSAALLAVAATGCEDIDNENFQGNWYNTYRYFPGTPRGGAVCFQLEVGDSLFAFVGTGANTNKTEEQERFRDFYRVRIGEGGLPVWTARYDRLYDSGDRASTVDKYGWLDAEAWEAVASLPNDSVAKVMQKEANNDQIDTVGCHARNGGVAFSLNGKGYVGLGYDGTDFLKDFWCYDYETNSWSPAPKYPGDAVRYAVAFVIDGKAYVGGGEDYDNNILGDFYCFDGQKWSTIETIGVPRAQATAFVCNGYGYVFGGINGSTVTAFQRYNPKTNRWEELRQLKNNSRQSYDDQYVNLAAYGATSFVLNNGTMENPNPDCRAFVTTGGYAGVSTLTWEYNPIYDYWIQKSSFEGSARKFACSFVLRADVDGLGEQEVAFVTTGSTSDMSVTGQSANFYADTYLWQPQAPQDDLDN